MSSRLIVLRGNSGSGKTTTAKLLQKQLGYGTMLVSQDVIRREMLRVKDDASNPAINLIYDLCMYGNRVGYTVILEGILSSNKYGAMLRKLLDDFDGAKNIYYFDIPFDETIRRHANKTNSHEFGEKEMRQWWKDKDYLGVEGETIIDENMTQDQIVSLIKDQSSTLCNNTSLSGEIRHTNSPGQTDYLFRVSLKSVILNEAGEVLLVKEAGRDWWDIPGGGIDHGETIKQALARELHEEVSLSGDFKYEAILTEDPRLIVRHNLYQMRITFLVRPERLEFAPGDDSDEVMFVDPLEFKNSELITERKIYEYSQLAKIRLD